MNTKRRLFTAAAVLCVFTSCASSTPETKPDGAASPSDAVLLDESTKAGATDVTDSSAFSDLEAKKNDAEKKEALPVEDSSAASTAAPVADGDTFYSTVGGESLRRVALTLYSDKTFSKKLLDKNPDLKGVKKLPADQKVFFDMASARPEPRYLNKDLLSRYTASLAERVEAVASEKGLAKTSATLNKGESLQDLSQRLYGTHRYWTEIYLVNHDKIANFDKVKAGLSLSVVNRPNSGVAKAEAAPAVLGEITPEPEAPKAPLKSAKKEKHAKKAAPPAPPVEVTTQAEPEPAPLPEPMPIQKAEPAPLPKLEPIAKEVPKDPIPEIPPAADKAMPAPVPVAVEPKPLPLPEIPKPVAEAPKPLPMASAHVDEPTSANASLRRILYVVLILVIGGAAFYFTRTPKRPKVDMLDLNADAGARPKLAAAPKDSQKSS